MSAAATRLEARASRHVRAVGQELQAESRVAIQDLASQPGSLAPAALAQCRLHFHTFIIFVLPLFIRERAFMTGVQVCRVQWLRGHRQADASRRTGLCTAGIVS